MSDNQTNPNELLQRYAKEQRRKPSISRSQATTELDSKAQRPVHPSVRKVPVEDRRTKTSLERAALQQGQGSQFDVSVMQDVLKRIDR